MLFFTVRLSADAQGLRTPPAGITGTLIFPLQEQHAHGSSMVSLPNGDLLAAWFQGSGERKADDVKIMGALLQKGKTTWSKPFLLADTPGLPDCNPVLFLNHHGKLFLVWIAVLANRWEYSLLKYKTATNFAKDGKPVWSWQDNILLKPDDRFASAVEERLKALPGTGAGWGTYAPRYDDMIITASQDPAKRSLGWMTRIRPLLLPDDRILLPLYSDGFNLSLVAISDDDGTSWKAGLPIVGRGNVQPALAQRKDGSIVAFMRDNGDAPSRMQISLSRDGGMSWTAAAKTDIPSTASVAACVLQDGKWALLLNDADDGRYRLSLYLSDDEGKTWRWKIPVEDHPPGQGSFSYPALIQTPDGLLHMTYSFNPVPHRESIRHAVADPEKLTR
ncbi:sialidase family protein [Compostibacter hankyongensis]|uniref:sialidase family protein n=1 Tax=Compostibacter hankyongensis TaxID=1007089 RepID=UPI0031EC1E91